MRDKRPDEVVLISFHTKTATDEDNDLIDLFMSGAEQAAAYSKDKIQFAICMDPSIKNARVVAYHKGVQEGYFRIDMEMIPIQIASKILHLSARILKQYKRTLKKNKYPEIAKIKNEIRSISKQLKETPEENKRNKLMQTKENLIDKLIQKIPLEKQEIRRIKLENKKIIDRDERQKANKIVHEMKKKLKNNTDAKTSNNNHKNLKKNIDFLRKVWRECRADESLHDYKEEIEKLNLHRELNHERYDDDSEEVEELFKVMKAVKEAVSPDEKLDPELEKEYEFMSKVRDERHKKQKQEGNFRPRDENGDYLYDDYSIRTGDDRKKTETKDQQEPNTQEEL